MRFWKNNKQFAWLGGVLIGLLSLGIGAVGDQFAVIWKKAVMICMECIGIG